MRIMDYESNEHEYFSDGSDESEVALVNLLGLLERECESSSDESEDENIANVKIEYRNDAKNLGNNNERENQ